MKLRLILMAVVALLMSSCSSVRHTSSAYEVDTKVVNFTVADVKVSEKKVEMTTSWSWNPFRRVSISTEKSNLTARLLKEHNADVLIDPQYIVVKRGFMRGGSITVIGFPAKYTGFHPMNETEAAVAKQIIDSKEKKHHKKFLGIF